jgi:hypothetical protein
MPPLKSLSELQSLVKGRLSGVKLRVNHVTEYRTGVDRHDAEYQNSTYLPFEILSKIFIDCLHSDRIQKPQPNVNVAPLLLCRICHHWRDVAMAIPQLWVDLQIRLPTVSQSPQLHNNLIPLEELVFIDNWVAHARPYPPSLYITKYRLRFKREILEKFMSFEDFCASPPIRSSRSLELELSRNDFRAICVSRTPFRNLEYLMMVGTLEDDGPPSSTSFKFPPSPLLRRLHLDCGFFESAQKISRILPLVQLTHLCIEWDINDANWLELLEQCPNLQCGIFKLALSTKVTKHVLHDHMRQMVLQCTRFDGLPATFEGLLFPMMQSLRLSIPYECLPSSNITTEELQAILKSTPTLTELHIQSCVKVSDPTDSSNQIRKSLSSYVPNLKVLVIDKINNILSSRQIIPFLQSNWLREGWSSAFRIRVEIILISLRHFFSSAAAFRAIIDHVNSVCGEEHGDNSLEVVLRQENEAQWEWTNPPSRDMRDRWQERMKFYQGDCG